MRWRFGERAAGLCIIPTIKHGGGSGMVVGVFCQMKCQGFAKGKCQIESDQLSENTAAISFGMEHVAQGFKIW